MILLKKPGVEKTFPLSVEVGTVLSSLWRYQMLRETRAASFVWTEFGILFALEQEKRQPCLLGGDLHKFP